jgi:cysteinyl-tRNA synthetase
MIKIYNSLTNKVEEFKPIKEKTIMMYVCGSTVYNNMHIGNSRPIILFDVVARFFKYLGYDVYLVSNFTDIDDKIINKAKLEKVTETIISERYIKEILETYKKLNCLPHFRNPKVTENMDGIIDFIKVLVDKGGAYVVDGDVYFNVAGVDDYGILSGQTTENLIAGARVEENDKKKSPNDFNLWKETFEGLKWDSPWSCGRPGWHTECVVMVNKIFNGKIDIHGGGSDLKFPHHDNEIAQAEVAYGHHIANYWMHNGRIDMQGEKMSKSLGNVIMADDFVDKVGYEVYRLMLLNVPYRQLLNYRDELVTQVITDYEKISRAYLGLFRRMQIEFGETNYEVAITNHELLELENEFKEAMSDDFNTPNAITTIFKMVKLINGLTRMKDIDINYLKETLSLYNRMLWVLGINSKVLPLNEEELEIVQAWQKARNEKNFDVADKYRLMIQDKGIIL